MGNPFSSSKTLTESQTSNFLNQLMSQISNSATSQNTITPNEDPMFTAYRQSILPAISQAYAQAQKPVYGDAQIAQAINNGNNVTNAAENSVSNRAARSGGLNSGAQQAADTALTQGNAANITGLMNEIPYLNQTTNFNETGSLLNLATNFLGRSPLGQTSTGQTQSTQNQNSTSSGQSNSQGQETQTSNPSLFSDIMGVAGLALAPFTGGASLALGGVGNGGGGGGWSWSNPFSQGNNSFGGLNPVSTPSGGDAFGIGQDNTFSNYGQVF